MMIALKSLYTITNVPTEPIAISTTGTRRNNQKSDTNHWIKISNLDHCKTQKRQYYELQQESSANCAVVSDLGFKV
jgi:hypothetical protein